MTGSREDRLASELAARLDGCPGADDLQRFHEAKLDAGEREAIATHVERCASCRDAVRFLKGTGSPEEEAGFDLPADVEQRSEEALAAVSAGDTATAAGRWSYLLRAAAGVLLVAALAIGGYQVLGPDGTGGDLGELRGDEPLVLIAPKGQLEAPPTEMSWIAHPDAKFYRVTLLDENLEEVWSHRTGDAATSLRLDGVQRAAFAAGGSFTWQVEALSEVGGTIERSGATHFDVLSSP